MGPPTLLQQKIIEHLEPIVSKMGYFLLAAELVGMKNKTLCLYFERNDGNITIKDLSYLSRFLRDAIEVEFEESRNWDLEVSSPGVDREIKTDRERKFFINKEVRIVMKNGKVIEGKLLDSNDGEIIMEFDSEKQVIHLNEIARMNLHSGLK